MLVADPLGPKFQRVILQELDKVSAFYQAKEEELQVRRSSC